jgi:hypothetical protein
MKSLINLFFLLIVVISSACGQSNTLNGVYAGLEIMPSGDMGGGMSRDDIAYLFRPDGTFTNKLNKPDWKTRVDGRYSVSGKTINLKYASNNRTTQYKLDKDGNIDAGGYDLIRQPTDSSVPAGYYKFSKMNSTGGGSSGMVYAGVGSDNNLTFDGKGNFSNSKSSATAVIGNVGGGSSRKSSGKGTYKINKGTLTLSFDDGRIETHSFFCRPGYKPVMAVIDGNIFFMDNEKEQQAKTSSRTTKRDPVRQAGETDTSEAAASGSIADAKAVLLKANAVHGGPWP